MKRLFVSLVAIIAAASLVVAGCSQAAPEPTKAPAAPAAQAAPTKAPAAPAAQAAPTKAPAQPTAAPAKQASWPEKGKSATLIVPWDAGGGTDIQGRVTAPTLEKILGIPVQVVNKPGGGTQIGLNELVKSKPDGYTIAMTNLPTTLSTYLDPERKPTFGRKDIQPVANQVVDPGSIAVKADSPYKTLKDLVDAVKANPEKIKISTAGVGTNTHMDLLMFMKVAGIQPAQVHFTGGAPAITALLGGHIDASSQTAGNYANQYKAKEVRLLGIMDAQRGKFYPDVPTMKESGYDVVSISSRGYSVVGGTPREIVNAWSDAIKKAIDDPDVQKRMDEMALEQRYMNVDTFSALWDKMDSEFGPLMELARQQQK